MEIENITFDEYKAMAADGNGPVVLDFYADWCGPCRMLAPVFDEVAEEHPTAYRYARVNVDEQPELTSSFGISVIPTLVVTNAGKEIARSTGYLDKEGLVAFLNL